MDERKCGTISGWALETRVTSLARLGRGRFGYLPNKKPPAFECRGVSGWSGVFRSEGLGRSVVNLHVALFNGALFEVTDVAIDEDDVGAATV